MSCSLPYRPFHLLTPLHSPNLPLLPLFLFPFCPPSSPLHSGPHPSFLSPPLLSPSLPFCSPTSYLSAPIPSHPPISSNFSLSFFCSLGSSPPLPSSLFPPLLCLPPQPHPTSPPLFFVIILPCRPILHLLPSDPYIVPSRLSLPYSPLPTLSPPLSRSSLPSFLLSLFSHLLSHPYPSPSFPFHLLPPLHSPSPLFLIPTHDFPSSISYLLYHTPHHNTLPLTS